MTAFNIDLGCCFKWGLVTVGLTFPVILLPLVGMLPVAGLPFPQIQANIAAALASKMYRYRMPDGREAVIVIDADEVTAIVAEYRPICVNGDVSKPGGFPCRPSVAARQLVAVAGSYDMMRIRMNNPSSQRT
ncbi:hypothetical protein [Bradyrhizobium mercantei]|uniref:hypothetical protein n=1 Tax=Bradyrhizobium mercantei TaxID=1904807 RepID=UPI001FD91343|nr:hypothetical protein [Bradyrhizobium mercantei]